MRKTLATAAAFMLTAALSAENIFKGNTFSVEDDEVFYKFTDDKNAKIVSNDTDEGEIAHMELGKKESADRIVNALLYSAFFSDSEYDENVDYKAKLRETDYGEEESELGEEAEKGLYHTSSDTLFPIK